MILCDEFLKPNYLWTRGEVLSLPSPVPKQPGVYAWYFRNIDCVPALACHAQSDFRLLYVGISPSPPPTNGKSASRETLYGRIRYHMQGNAEGSTLRLSLGCLLAEPLGIELRRVGSGRRMTFASGERRLSDWMDENARVVWRVSPEPWLLESQLIGCVDLPLNLDQNKMRSFHGVLSGLRRTAKARARELPIAV
jgi:hypothetical protein